MKSVEQHGIWATEVNQLHRSDNGWAHIAYNPNEARWYVLLCRSACLGPLSGGTISRFSHTLLDAVRKAPAAAAHLHVIL